MATLYVENVPDDLYEALRKRARSQRRSIAAEVLSLLEQNFPTETVLKQRRAFIRKLDQMRSSFERRSGDFPSSDEMLREDRSR